MRGGVGELDGALRSNLRSPTATDRPWDGGIRGKRLKVRNVSDTPTLLDPELREVEVTTRPFLRNRLLSSRRYRIASLVSCSV